MTQIKWAELTPEQRNALVAEKVMNWQEKPCDGEVVEQGVYWSCSRCGLSGNWSESDFDRFSGHVEIPPNYTTNIDAAWLVVEHLRKKRFDVHVASAPFQYDVAILDRRMGGKSFEASAHSAPDAISQAALLACGIEVIA